MQRAAEVDNKYPRHRPIRPGPFSKTRSASPGWARPDDYATIFVPLSGRPTQTTTTDTIKLTLIHAGMPCRHDDGSSAVIWPC